MTTSSEPPASSAPSPLSARPDHALPRVLGAAVTGAVLATGARGYLSWSGHRGDRACRPDGGLCLTWWNLTAVPLVLAVTLVVLTVVYRRLGIGPRLVIIPPTVLLAPVPLAVGAASGSSAVALTGAAWSGCLALAAWRRYRVPALTASAVILLAAMVVRYPS
ncbi:hypothetical protein [Streptomyces collinus]|uniref:hypothetical protein n=1 Tax=Streptomyces collinus TaxID=42684 RepID=UPI003B22288C